MFTISEFLKKLYSKLLATRIFAHIDNEPGGMSGRC